MKETKYIGDELSLFKDATTWKNYWFNQVKKYIKGDVLEVGAGIGINSNLIIQHPEVNSLLAVEPDGLLSSQIIQNLETDSQKISVFTGFIDDIEASKKFDTIIYIDVIEHIKNDKEELVKAASRLKDGGHLIILVPAFNFLYSPFDKAIGHYRRYDKSMLIDAMPGNLNRIKLFYLDSLGFCASLVNKLILKQSYPTKSQVLKWDRVIVPCSKISDKVVFQSFGKSLIGIWIK